MKEYFAKSRSEPLGIFLTKDQQMEKYLQEGWDIYETENGNEKLIATPEKGFLTERPSFPSSETMKGR